MIRTSQTDIIIGGFRRFSAKWGGSAVCYCPSRFRVRQNLQCRSESTPESGNVLLKSGRPPVSWVCSGMRRGGGGSWTQRRAGAFCWLTGARASGEQGSDINSGLVLRFYSPAKPLAGGKEEARATTEYSICSERLKTLERCCSLARFVVVDVFEVLSLSFAPSCVSERGKDRKGGAEVAGKKSPLIRPTEHASSQSFISVGYSIVVRARDQLWPGVTSC